LARRRTGIVYNEQTDLDGAAIFRQACRGGLEGIVLSGRSQNSNRGGAGQHVAQKPDALSPQLSKNAVRTRNVAAWASEIDAWRDRGTDNRNRLGDSLNCPHHRSAEADRGNNGCLTSAVARSGPGSVKLRDDSDFPQLVRVRQPSPPMDADGIVD
jgi:hypothetical protein